MPLLLQKFCIAVVANAFPAKTGFAVAVVTNIFLYCCCIHIYVGLEHGKNWAAPSVKLFVPSSRCCCCDVIIFPMTHIVVVVDVVVVAVVVVVVVVAVLTLRQV